MILPELALVGELRLFMAGRRLILLFLLSSLPFKYLDEFNLVLIKELELDRAERASERE